MGSLITAAGLYPDITPDEYFAEPCPEPALSNSGIGILLSQSPAHFARQHPAIGQPEDDRQASAAMHRGSVVHRLALGKGKDFAVLDFADYRKDVAKAARAEAEEAGLVPILAVSFKEAEQQARVIGQHLDDVLLGEPFQPEVVVAWIETTSHGPVWCRGMIDAWCPSLLKAVDLKSTTDAAAPTIRKRMVNGGYDTQDSWYCRGIGKALGKPGRISFVTLFAENDPPHASQAFSITESWRTSAWDDCAEALEIFARHQRAGTWPSYPREVQTLSPPDWLIPQRINRRFQQEAA